MRLSVNGHPSVVIDDSVAKIILGVYPEEELAERPVFKDGFQGKMTDIEKFKEECRKISIPWQMFLLEIDNLTKEIEKIENNRQHKFSAKYIAKRRGEGNTPSLRIIDRLIRAQNFLDAHSNFEDNIFCGSLKTMTAAAAAQKIATHFGVDRLWFRRKKKAKALEYIIDRISAGRINICIGVLKNGILPELSESKAIYKSASGFVLKDSKVPFMFIPGETNPDEKEGRQIFTIIFLTALIGLDAYDTHIDKDFKTSMLSSSGTEGTAYAIASEFLVPWAETQQLKGTTIDEDVRDDLASKYCITPSAIIVILRKRKIISQQEYESLLPQKSAPINGRQHGQTPKVEKSAEKFVGKYVYSTINTCLRKQTLMPVAAQYLIFGAVNKKKFKEYVKNLAL
jgi:Zn-dependent peptidase ImmA (M78 family)